MPCGALQHSLGGFGRKRCRPAVAVLSTASAHMQDSTAGQLLSQHACMAALSHLPAQHRTAPVSTSQHSSVQDSICACTVLTPAWHGSCRTVSDSCMHESCRSVARMVAAGQWQGQHTVILQGQQLAVKSAGQSCKCMGCCLLCCSVLCCSWDVSRPQVPYQDQRQHWQQCCVKQH